MDEEAVEPQAEPIEQIMDQHEADTNDQEAIEQEKPEKTMVPLSAVQKLRQQKKELELELQWERQRNMKAQQPAPVEEDNSRFESATREDLRASQEEAMRNFEERLWIKQNPEKYERINEYLPQFLKQRPNLALAIDKASNRYEEAYTLMDALTPREQKQLKNSAAPKKEAPNSPGSVPKRAAMNEAVNLMDMSDSEFAAWRASKKKSR